MAVSDNELFFFSGHHIFYPGHDNNRACKVPQGTGSFYAALNGTKGFRIHTAGVARLMSSQFLVQGPDFRLISPDHRRGCLPDYINGCLSAKP